MRRMQRGITFLGFVIVAAVFGLFIFVGMTLYPMYSESFSVRAAMRAVANEPGAATMTPETIYASLVRRFDISYVESVKRDNVYIYNQNGRKLRIAYEVRKPMVYNIDVVAKFDHVVDLTRQSVDP